MGGTDFLEYSVYLFLIPILIYTSFRLAMKTKLHGNMRFNVTLMTLSVLWMLLIRIITLITLNWEDKALLAQMTGYVLHRTKQDWSTRHQGASLSQRYQIAESIASAKLFLPLTASNFLSVLFLLGNLAAIAFGELPPDTQGLCWTMLDWTLKDLKIHRESAYNVHRLLQFLSNFAKRRKGERRNTISVTPIRPKTETDEYFKNYKTMWA
ncbi:unnamed protein product, partial [Mesorhabditis belari]|uniref:Uncharacterized protein n=1 Tax=Mesorhabditis belari TaxID=2138241 RepID=A0AAF3EZA8_9BILA